MGCRVAALITWEKANKLGVKLMNERKLKCHNTSSLIFSNHKVKVSNMCLNTQTLNLTQVFHVNWFDWEDNVEIALIY